MSGITIGNGCVIGAGSVVTKIFRNSLAVGNPAKVIRKLNE
jgi:maltose O-acetyltransferase